MNFRIVGNKIHLILFSLILFVIAMPGIALASGPDPLQVLYEMKDGYARVHDYKATFVRQEKTGSKLKKEEIIALEFRRPFMIKMRWENGPKKGREVVFVEGENENKMLVRLNGMMGVFVKMLLLDPEGALAKKESRHSIRQGGIGNLINSLIKVTQEAEKSGDLNIRLVGEEIIQDRSVFIIERNLPAGKYEAPRTLIYVDKQLRLPIQILRFDENGNLFERYVYEDLKINQDISATTFLLKDRFERKLAEEKKENEKIRNIIAEATSAYENINDYSATFHKTERVNGGQTLEEIYSIRFMKPFSLGFRIVEGKYRDMEIYYRPLVDGNNKMIVYPGGMMGNLLSAINMKSVSVPIDTDYVKKYHRHFVSEFGIGHFLERYKKDFEKGVTRKEVFGAVYYDSGEFQGEPGYEVELILKNRKRLADYYAYRTLVYFSERNKLPIEIKVFDENGDLLERYRYKDLKLNSGLTDADFDPGNSEYRNFQSI